MFEVYGKEAGKDTYVEPLGDRMMVKRVEGCGETKEGILIPDAAKDTPQQADVLLVGPGRTTEEGKLIPMKVKVGDRVLFVKYAYNEVTIDGEEYLMLKEEEILGIVRQKEPGAPMEGPEGKEVSDA